MSISATAGTAPAHVPPDLVRSFSFYDDPAILADPMRALSGLHDGPRIFWNTINPRHGGSWVLTRAEDIRYVTAHPELFSNKGQFRMAAVIGESWDMIPGELDPPDLHNFRKLVGAWLGPPAVAAMSDQIRERAVSLITGLIDNGGCEFMNAFALRFPVSIFVDLMGLPQDHAPMFLQWEHGIIHAPNMNERAAAISGVADYLRAVLAERRRKPADDLFSRAILAEVNGVKLSDDQILGICFMLFTGGLDTVASSMGFQFHYLAEHPEVQARLRTEPALASRFVEELLRANSVVVIHRVATCDTEVSGVAIRTGDWIAIPTALGSIDPEDSQGSTGVDMDRRAVRHMAFGVGPHFCLGMHLARRELTIAVEEWVGRAPVFRTDETRPVKYKGGGVFVVDTLPIRWD